MPVRVDRFILLAGIATLALLAAGSRPALAQQESSSQIVLSNIRDLDFGRFVAGSGGTVILSASGLRSSTGAVILLNSPSVGQAAFNVSRSTNGETTESVIISLPQNGTTHLFSGSNRMAVDNFVATPAVLQSIPPGGVPLSVGATLVVEAGQPPGDYSGTFNLTVNFE